MITGNVLTVLLSVLSGSLAGTAVAVLNYFLTRKKREAEIQKLEAETEKIRIEISSQVLSVSATVDYKLGSVAEFVIYDSREGINGYDFPGEGASIWKFVDGNAKPVTPKGTGFLKVEKDGILSIQRTNTDGRYEIWLSRYSYGGIQQPHIPRNDSIAGQRIFRISCQAKATCGEHVLDFILKNEEANIWLAHQKRRITQNVWTPRHIPSGCADGGLSIKDR